MFLPQVLFRHVPREEDELELIVGDYVYVAAEAMATSPDGWVLGTSWLTGCSGFLPKNHVRQTAKTDAWTLHMCLPMGKVSKVSPRLEEKDRRSPSVRIRLDSTSSRRAEGAAAAHRTDLEVESLTLSSALPVSTSTPTTTLQKHSADRRKSPRPRKPRRVFIARHGERVDFTFGTWIPFCFENGKYVQKDLNMPASVPRRLSGPEGFARDCPLTHIGMVQARLLGNALLKSGVSFTHAFTSPALRCVQTCHHILEGMNLAKSVKMRLEPGLFEWLAWYQNSMPEWMSAEELSEAGFNVDEKWKPFIGSDELQDTQESREQFYTRNFFVTQCILQATEESATNLLFVGHAATLEVCTRQITGQSPRQLADFMNVVRRAPYCSLAVMEEQLGTGAPAEPKASSSSSRSPSSWRVVEPPSGVWPITHSGNSRYDWKMLVETATK
jgi:ubiquitin-associated SH3 domain-containing protein